MGFRFPQVVKAKQLLQRSFSNSSQISVSSLVLEDVPKGYLAVYVGDESVHMKRFVIPVSFLNKPSFQQLLSQSEEEFGFNHLMGGLTIPCRQDIFIELVYRLNASCRHR